MPGRAGKDDERLAEEIERYREPAELALDQLDACADLLVEMRKISLARQILTNRRNIQRAMRGRG